MKAHLRSLSIGLAAIVLAGACVAPDTGGVAPDTRGLASPEVTKTQPRVDAPLGTEASPALEVGIETRPVDPALVPVSRSDPGPEAQAVLDLCGLDPDRISGMAKIPKARDLPRYVRLTGKEPEIQVDEPAWVVTYSGRIVLPRALGWAEDPICVVIDGEPTVFLSGRHGRGDLESEPLPVPDPVLALPPLAP